MSDPPASSINSSAQASDTPLKADGSESTSSVNSTIGDDDSSTTSHGDVPPVVTTEGKILEQLRASALVWKGTHTSVREQIFGGNGPTTDEVAMKGLVSADRFYQDAEELGTKDFYAASETGKVSTLALDPLANKLVYTSVSANALTEDYPNPFHALEEDVLVTNDSFSLGLTAEEIAAILNELSPADAKTATLTGKIDGDGKILSLSLEGRAESSITRSEHTLEINLTTEEEAAIPSPLPCVRKIQPRTRSATSLT